MKFKLALLFLFGLIAFALAVPVENLDDDAEAPDPELKEDIETASGMTIDFFIFFSINKIFV